ncbi:hypothetical protein [Halorientalis salina]|uniref:hypothetical protein n=1 Tax=Halorientalis salina TaxID=2932266 RepID=UPI0010AC17DF|nr:hypothetical protein [Halorientalis salina]
MTEANFDELATVLEQDDDDLKTDLPAALAGIEDDIDTLLLEHPDSFEALSLRLSTLDGIADYAAAEPETVDRFLAVLWGGLGLISENVPEVQEQVTEAFSVTWTATDSEVTFHMTSEPDTGTVDGGPGLLDDPTLAFEGETDILFSMLNDPDFNPVTAFMDGSFELQGAVDDAMAYAQMMETVTTNVENLN